MKKIKILLFIAFLMLFSSKVNALQTDIRSINQALRIQENGLIFNNLKFDIYSVNNDYNIGFMGLIENKNSSDLGLNFNIIYYDSNKEIIAKDIKKYEIGANAALYYNLHSLSSKLNVKAFDIKYYKFSYDIISGNVDYIGEYEDNSNLSDEDNLQNNNEQNNNEQNNNELNNNLSNDNIQNDELEFEPNNNYSSYDYYIDKYDITIVVNDNNTFDITENITAYFNVPKHGIFRTIPLRNQITRLDGTTSSNRTQITNLNIDNKYTTSIENGIYKINIGSANYMLTGKQTYTIKYTYNLGKDPMKEYDELYYNLIGKDWDTIINNVTFKIIMPKDFDSSKLGFSSGTYGSTANNNVEYSVTNNTITGSYNGTLDEKEALTVRCELPEGYFVGAGLKTNYLIILTPIFFFLISLLIWYKYGRDDKVVETVEFYPPDGLNSLDVGFLYKGKAESKDVTSLLIYLANKGYIEISNNEIDLNAEKVKLSEIAKTNANQKIIELQNKINFEKQIDPNSSKIKYYENMLDIYKNIDNQIDYEQYVDKSSINKFNKKNKIFIKKLKDYDGTNINEQWFMEALFAYNRTEVTDEMLYNNFYITNNRILSNVNNKQNRAKIFEKLSLNKIFLFILMIIMIMTTYCLITIPPILNYGQPKTLPFALLFPSIGFTLMFIISFGEKQIFNDNEFGSLIFKFFGLIAGIMCGGFPWAAIVLPALIQDPAYLISYFIGLGSVLGMILCLKYMKKRTKYGNEILGKIKGFRNFLITVEKDKLEVMVMQDPEYFYNILPYTYVLDVSDKWIEKFETINIKEPNWYDSSNTFDMVSFGSFMNSTMFSAQSAMTSSPSSSAGSSSSEGSSSGSSSGGGSSGGGSGGGGGGSW